MRRLIAFVLACGLLIGCSNQDSGKREGDVELTPEQKASLGSGPSDGPGAANKEGSEAPPN